MGRSISPTTWSTCFPPIITFDFPALCYWLPFHIGAICIIYNLKKNALSLLDHTDAHVLLYVRGLCYSHWVTTNKLQHKDNTAMIDVKS